jgi:hypothetical protein
MRSATHSLSMLVAIALLSGAAPATRPAAGRLLLKVCRYDGVAVVTSAEITVDAGVPFSSRTRVGDTTIALDGTIATRGRTCLIRLGYDEATFDPGTGGTGHRQFKSVFLRSDIGREQEIGGSVSGRHVERVAATVTEAVRY